MLVAPAMGPTVVRSSLEIMLDSLKQRDDEKLKNSMPALPSRPVSRGRLPSSRRPLQVKFNNGTSFPIAEEAVVTGVREDSKEEDMMKIGFFARKKMGKLDQPEVSPYKKTRLDEEKGSEDCVEVENKMHFVLRKELKVWCWLPDAMWVLGKLQSVSGDDAHVLLNDDKVLSVSTENIAPANPDVLNGVDDLVQLSYLNTPSILHNFQTRYSRNMIYTKAGQVLIALNPFKDVSVHAKDLIASYSQGLLDGPHIFALADTAYNDMMRDGTNQSIIVSGESGSGKTETAKFAMSYLAAIGGGDGIEHKVLQTNLILESFGNAKTSRNDNSSRFGKLTEIHFSSYGKICGAMIETFLLEKSRVVQRSMSERSFHVFYQLCAGAPQNLKDRLNLKAANEYEYLKQSNCLIIEDVDDALSFQKLVEALDIVNICKEDQENAFAMLATVLWLGNIGYSVNNENHVEVDLSEGVTNAAKLMGCQVSDLMLSLSTQKLETGSGVKKLTISQAIDARDALATSIYVSLFDWLVERINNSLQVGKGHTGRSISILDIYGFESFNRNSFEQLCINYANERLQQHFIRHLFKLQQEEYIQNGIDWINVDFVDNTECLNLFEKKPIGILSMLDEESTITKSTDVTFANKLRQQFGGNPYFKGEKGSIFKINHSSGEVSYNTIGFLEKNRDFLHSDSIQFLSSCSHQLPQLFAARMLEKYQKPASLSQQLGRLDSQMQSVGSKVKNQMFMLMEKLENTTPHFIRCIKPNEQCLPCVYDYNLVLQQLKCCGIPEVVRISKSGYPAWRTHQQFAERYGFILLNDVVSEDPPSVSTIILQRFNVRPDMYQVGYSKIFLRAGQIAAMEEVRNRTLHGILCVQKLFRGHKARQNFQTLINGVTSLQSFIRGWSTRKSFNRLITTTETSKTKKVKVDIESCKHQGLKPTNLEELQRRVTKAEEALIKKEEENLRLQNQLQQYKSRWSEYEANMKSMEETWQKQMASLQMSLAASNGHLNSEGDVGTQNPIGHIRKEFDQKSQAFEDDATKFLVEVKSGQLAPGTDSEEELQTLKTKFTSWKKDYKAKLRETKAELKNVGNSGEVKKQKKWWILRCKK